MNDATTLTGSRVLDEIAEVIGVSAAFALGVAFRGERVYIPKNPDNLPGLVEAVGEDRALRLCRILGGNTFAIPERAVLHHHVKHLADEGTMTKREIARHLKIGEAYVYRILRRWREDDDQPRLF